MLQLVDLIVALTGHRDRESLDIGLAQTLSALFKPQKVVIFGVMSDAKERRWLPLTMVRPDHPVEKFSSLHADFRTLDLLFDVRHRWQCLNSGAPVDAESVEDSRIRVNYLPFATDHQSEQLGVIEVHVSRALSPEELGAARRVLQAYCNMQSMFAYSECDALTGLLNRKSFDDTFYKSFGGQQQKGSLPSTEQPDNNVIVQHRAESSEMFWLVMVDIDHFKSVNDKFGHQIGDEVLILVARILRSTFRGSDRIYRFGGEEFVVLLRCPDHQTAVNVVERFRIAMEKFLFPQAGQITASVGLSDIKASDTPESACERADQAVYFAKHNGRNRVSSYSDLKQKGLLQSDVKVGDIELF